jgi:hypothetical protein
MGCIVLWAVWGAARRSRHPLAGAQQLDRHHGLAGRVSNALAFSRDVAPDGLKLAAIADAERFASQLSPRQAVPVPIPGELWVSLLLLAALGGISLLEVRHTYVIPRPIAAFEAAALDEDDLAILREMSERLERQDLDAETAAAVRQFNQLVTDVAERRLDRKQIFERLERLETGLIEGTKLDAESLDEGLKGLAQELQHSRLSKPAAEALEQKNLADAEAALRDLAKRLKQPVPAGDKAELEKLRKALAAASTGNAERAQRLEAERQEVENQRKRLLQKKNEAGKLGARDQAALERSERELKRLDRQKQRADKTAQQFSELDKELAKAAEALRKELGEAAKSLESSAERLNQVAKQKLTDADKQSLKKQIEELREMLRQAKQGGKQREQLQQRFRQRAAGQGSGKPGEGKGQGGQGKQAGQPGGPPKLSLGGGGQSIELPGSEGATPGAAKPGNGQAGGDQPGGKEWGSGTNADARGDETKASGKLNDVSAAGIDTGEGTASSEVVFSAGERGFTSNGYRKVYTDYKTVAEETLTDDQIPAGYKFYVRRYFQLIRPRE